MADASIKIRGGAGNAVQIQSRAVDAAAPSDTEVLAWNATDAEWEPTAAGGGVTSEWTDTGTVLHPADSSGTLDNVVIGGTSLANSDIALGVDGSAVFNEQSADVDFRVESNGNTHMLFVDGGGDTVGIGCTPVEAASSNPSCLLVVSNKSTPSTPAQYSPLVVEHDSAASYVNIIAEDNVSGSYTGLKLGDASNPDEASIVYDAHGKRMYFTGNGESNANATMVMDPVANAVGVNVIAPGEALSVDGVVALKTQGSAPSLTADYAKIYTEAFGNASDTKLLLHMDGSNDGVVFTDSSASGHTVTRYNAVTKTATKKFGTASGFFDGTGDYLTLPTSSDWDMGTGDFTFEFWVNFAAWGGSNIQWIIGGDDANDFDLTYYNGTNLWKFGINNWSPNFEFAHTASLATWYHVAVCRNGADLRMFVDGSQIGATQSDTTDIQVTGLNIGRQYNGTYYLNGYLDELRICKGTADYTSDFTPQRSAYPVSNIVIMDGGGATYKLGQNW